MHYKNGREVKVGDKFVSKDAYGNASGGTVVNVIPGSDSCNILYVPFGTATWSTAASDCLHIDDVMAAAAPIQPPATPAPEAAPAAGAP